MSSKLKKLAKFRGQLRVSYYNYINLLPPQASASELRRYCSMPCMAGGSLELKNIVFVVVLPFINIWGLLIQFG